MSAAHTMTEVDLSTSQSQATGDQPNEARIQYLLALAQMGQQGPDGARQALSVLANSGPHIDTHMLLTGAMMLGGLSQMAMTEPSKESGQQKQQHGMMGH